MGQRSQIILIHEGVNYGNKNPNDNSGQIYISHNQWRYGVNLIYVIRHLLDKYNIVEKFDINEGEFFFSRLDEIFNDCLRYAENHNINSELSQSHRFENVTKAFFESNKKKFDLNKFLNHYTDNNNGWTIIKVKKNHKIEIGFLNGLENADEIKQRTPTEMITLIQDIDGVDSKPDKEDLENIKALEKYGILDVYKECKKLHLRISKDYKGDINGN